MLNVKDVHVAYGQSEALHGISFEANRNETVAIMGRNGMGKTTLMKTLAGLLPVGDGARMLRRRPDVRQAERELAASTARIGVAVVFGDSGKSIMYCCATIEFGLRMPPV